MTLLKKYWFGIFLFIWVTVVIGFTSSQERFYLPADIEKFTHGSHLVLLYIEIAIFCLSLIWIAMEVKKVDLTLFGAAYLAIKLGIFYFFFHNIFTRSGLYLNRLVARDTVQRSYVATCLYGTEKSETNFFLYETGTKEQVSRDELVKAIYITGANPGDTVKVDLKKGWLGTAFFDPTCRISFVH